MTNFLLRHSSYIVLALGFVSSLLLAVEFDIVAVASSGSHKPARLELEELLTLSGLFSLALAALALFKCHVLRRERIRGAAMEQAAYADPLTGLSNRRRFIELLEQALARHLGGHGCALLLIDLDGFKSVNDRHGHGAGDALLVEVARRLRLLVSDPDHAARLGGDEFGLILTGREAEPFHARMTIRRLQAELGEPFGHCGVTLFPGGSVGLATARGPESTAASLLEEADFEMYRDKHRRKHRDAA